MRGSERLAYGVWEYHGKGQKRTGLLSDHGFSQYSEAYLETGLELISPPTLAWSLVNREAASACSPLFCRT